MVISEIAVEGNQIIAKRLAASGEYIRLGGIAGEEISDMIRCSPH